MAHRDSEDGVLGTRHCGYLSYLVLPAILDPIRINEKHAADR